MDIVGIWLLFCFGAIGGKWIEKPRSGFSLADSDEQAIARNERWASWGSWLGLGFAVTGFALQAWALWL